MGPINSKNPHKIWAWTYPKMVWEQNYKGHQHLCREREKREREERERGQKGPNSKERVSECGREGG